MQIVWFRSFVFLRLLGAVLYGFIFLDSGVLFFTERIQPRIGWIFWLSPKRTTVDESPLICDEITKNAWWIGANKEPEYAWQKLPEEEVSFPLAYTLIGFERPDQMWRLFRAIYRPQNYYCIHIDRKAFPGIKKWLQKRIQQCIPRRNNVFIIPSIPVVHSELSVLNADLACMKFLLHLPINTRNKNHPPWKFLINLTGQEFPLKSNLEITRILRAVNGTNMITLSPFDFWRGSFLHPTPPHDLVLRKGSLHVVLSWKFVEFIFTDQRVRDLLDYLRHVYVPDEAFFSTINYAPQLRAPGGYPVYNVSFTGEFGISTRWKKFWPWNCHGEWRHALCMFTIKDMEPLFRIDTPYLFVNKFVMDINYDVLDITEKWFFDRQSFQYKHKEIQLTDVKQFSEREVVKYRQNSSAVKH